MHIEFEVIPKSFSINSGIYNDYNLIFDLKLTNYSLDGLDSQYSSFIEGSLKKSLDIYNSSGEAGSHKEPEKSVNHITFYKEKIVIMIWLGDHKLLKLYDEFSVINNKISLIARFESEELFKDKILEINHAITNENMVWLFFKGFEFCITKA